MKAMVLLALIVLPVLVQADVVIPENEKRPARQQPVKTDTTVTASTTAATTTAGTTAATTSTTITGTAASPATQTTASPASPAPAPERRRSTFPFAALFTIGIALIAALSARRRRERNAQ